MNTALTIAGSDSCGGAGIQADIKTMTVNGVYAMSAITALTAQNTIGVAEIMEVSPSFLEAQLDAVFTDIFPNAVKIGMLSSGPIMHTVAEKLKEYKAKNVVLDPVMVSTSGSSLIKENSVEVMKNELFPLVDIITPNIPEAQVLSNKVIKNEKDMEEAAQFLFHAFDCAVLLKGGHSINDANDLLLTKDGMIWLKENRIDNSNTHGTGCTLSSAIAAFLAKGHNLEKAVRLAKEYLTGAIADGLDLGKGSGPLNHSYKYLDKSNIISTMLDMI